MFTIRELLYTFDCSRMRVHLIRKETLEDLLFHMHAVLSQLKIGWKN